MKDWIPMKLILLLLLLIFLTLPASAFESPEITSLSNDRSNDNSLILTIGTGDIIRFNVTSDQIIIHWVWKLNGNDMDHSSDAFTHEFDDKGSYTIAVNGSNNNGTTQTIIWNISVKEVEESGKRIGIRSWYPQAVDDVYVNDTINQAVEYIITLDNPTTAGYWTVDSEPVNGGVKDNDFYYTHTWDTRSTGFHTVVFTASNYNSQVEFRWNVNVYEIGKYKGGNIFEIIDDALENHITDIKIRMFRYTIENKEDNVDYATDKVNRLHDEIVRRQMIRESLRKEFRSGNITIEEYVSAVKQSQWDAIYDLKLAKEMAKIAKENLKNDTVIRDFENVSKMEEEWAWEKKINKTKHTEITGKMGKKNGGKKTSKQ